MVSSGHEAGGQCLSTPTTRDKSSGRTHLRKAHEVHAARVADLVQPPHDAY